MNTDYAFDDFRRGFTPIYTFSKPKCVYTVLCFTSTSITRVDVTNYCGITTSGIGENRRVYNNPNRKYTEMCQ